MRLQQIFQIKVHVEPESLGDLDSPLRFRAEDDSFYVTGDELTQARELGFVAEVIREIQEDDLPVRFLLPHQGAVNDPPPASARLAVLARLLSEGRANGDTHVRFLGRNRTVPPSGFILDRANGDRRYVWQVVPADATHSEEDLSERFRALRQQFAAPDTRVVLSLGSGGLRLFCHAAALRLIERIGCAESVDEVWGTSAGALVALLYSHGLSPQAIEQAGYDIYSGRTQLQFRPSTFQILRHLLRDVILPSENTEPTGFVDCAKSLSAMLDQYCDREDALWPFYATAYNLAECRPEILTAGPVPEHLAHMMVQTDPRLAAMASAAVPLLFSPLFIERNGERVPYIDGSTTEDVPLHSVVDKWDRDREAGVESRSRLLILYVKLTGATGPYRTRQGRMSKLRLLQTVAAAGIDSAYQRDLQLLNWRDDVDLCPLEIADSTPNFFEVSRIPEFIREAKETFPAQLAKIERGFRER